MPTFAAGHVIKHDPNKPKASLSISCLVLLSTTRSMRKYIFCVVLESMRLSAAAQIS